MGATFIQRCLCPNLYREDPERGWGLLVALAFFWVEVCTFGTLRTLALFPQLLTDKSWRNDSRVSWVISTCLFVFAFTAPLSTFLSSRFGPGPVVMTGGVLLSLGTISSAFTSSIDEMFLTTGVISGLGSCLTFFPTITILLQYFSRRRVLVTAVASSGESLALIVLTQALFRLTERFGRRGCLLVLGLIQASVIGCGFLLRPIIIEPECGPQTDSVKQKQTVYELQDEHRTSNSSGSDDSGVVSLSASSRYLRTGAEARALMKDQDKGQGSLMKDQDKGQGSLMKDQDKGQGSLMEDQDKGQGSPPDPLQVEAGPLQPSSPKLLDLSVLKDAAFICYSLSGLFASLSIVTFPLLVVEQSENDFMMLMISFFGIIMIIAIFVTDIVGRLLIGLLMNCVCCRKTLVLLGCVVLLGLVLVAFPLLPDPVGLVFLALIGFFRGAVASTHISLLAEEEVVGVQKMSSCLGVYVFIQSLAGLAVPPVGGVLVNVARYLGVDAAAPAGFYCSAVVMGLSAVCLALLGPAKRAQRPGRCREEGHRAEKPQRTPEDGDQSDFLEMD